MSRIGEPVPSGSTFIHPMYDAEPPAGVILERLFAYRGAESHATNPRELWTYDEKRHGWVRAGLRSSMALSWVGMAVWGVMRVLSAGESVQITTGMPRTGADVGDHGDMSTDESGEQQ